jgi:hypothetical protein
MAIAADLSGWGGRNLIAPQSCSKASQCPAAKQSGNEGGPKSMHWNFFRCLYNGLFRLIRVPYGAFVAPGEDR